MQSLPTEAKPLAACSQCGTALPRPSGSATFVYGVGAVGYQHCDTCGAKWRYLWDDPPGSGGALNRLPFLLVGAAIVVLIGIAGFAMLGSSTTYNPSSAAAGTTTPKAPTTHPSTTSSAAPASNGADFAAIRAQVDDARPPFVQFLETTALSSQQFEVDNRVKAFVSLAQQSVGGLKHARWPASAAADVDQLVAADQQFITDVDLIQYGLLYSTSFTQKLTVDVQSIQKYDSLVRRDLG